MTVDDARLILGKYKTNKQFDEFEMVDDVTGDELLTEFTETNEVKVGVSNKRESSDNDAANVKINYGHREDADGNKSPMGNDMSVDGSNLETSISKISDDMKCGRSENGEADSMASNENERGRYHEIATNVDSITEGSDEFKCNEYQMLKFGNSKNSECNIIKPKSKRFRAIDSNEEEDDRKVKKTKS